MGLGFGIGVGRVGFGSRHRDTMGLALGAEIWGRFGGKFGGKNKLAMVCRTWSQHCLLKNAIIPHDLCATRVAETRQAEDRGAEAVLGFERKF